VVYGQGDEVQKIEGLIVGAECVDTSVLGGRNLGHHGVVPSGHVPDKMDVSRVNLEKRFNEKCRVSLAKHPCEESIPMDEGDGSKGLVTIAIICRPGVVSWNIWVV
jgi:hypothetical protein